jgi:hypothetical protein
MSYHVEIKHVLDLKRIALINLQESAMGSKIKPSRCSVNSGCLLPISLGVRNGWSRISILFSVSTIPGQSIPPPIGLLVFGDDNDPTTFGRPFFSSASNTVAVAGACVSRELPAITGSRSCIGGWKRKV